MAIEDDMHAIVATILARPNQPIDARLSDALRVLSKWRVEALAREILPDGPLVVRGGPFAGMKYVATPAEGGLLPKVYGCYEQELHALVQSWAGRSYAQVVNIGCAEGYYAVGLARSLGVDVHARDISSRARELCEELAALNGVAERVHVGGELTHDDFATFAGKTLVLCDIEGAERALLDPTKAPALTKMDVLVEVHESFEPGVGRELEERFEATHAVKRFATGDRLLQLPEELFGRNNLDQLLAVWEWRLADPGWMWLEANT